MEGATVAGNSVGRDLRWVTLWSGR